MLIQPNTITLGRNLQALRKHYHISTLALAKLTGMPEGTICAMERGFCIPPIPAERLGRICQVFNIPLEDLLHRELAGLVHLPSKTP